MKKYKYEIYALVIIVILSITARVGYLYWEQIQFSKRQAILTKEIDQRRIDYEQGKIDKSIIKDMHNKSIRENELRNMEEDWLYVEQK